mgnify:CR=1 FL=1
MEENTMTREEMITEMMEKVNMLLAIKYSDDKEAVCDRELELLKLQLSACGFNDISSLEEKYKK